MAEYRARDIPPEKQFMAVLQAFGRAVAGSLILPSITKLSALCSSVANGNSN